MTPQEYILAVIDLEIYELKKIRTNLKRFAYFEIRKNNNFAKKFYLILDETERISIEIYELEKRKLQLLNLET